MIDSNSNPRSTRCRKTLSVQKMALLLTLLTFGCYRSKPATIDFGHGSIVLDKEYRFDERQTRREPESVRFMFTLVNDTHINGQTSYAENLMVSHLAPSLSEPDFRKLLNKGQFDVLSTKTPYSIEMDGNLEFQISSTIYERHPVTQPAILVRLIDYPNRRVIGWYGYTKHYKPAKAKEYLKQVLASVTLDPAVLDARFADYEKWKGNDWMGAYFDNQKLLAPALDTIGFETPFHQFIGDVSTWQSKGNLHLAIDGERPAYLHLVEVTGDQPCATINDISPDLRPGFKKIFEKQGLPTCFKVHKFNFWLPQPTEGNTILDWINTSLKRKP
jgi:hypothetical protein